MALEACRKEEELAEASEARNLALEARLEAALMQQTSIGMFASPSQNDVHRRRSQHHSEPGGFDQRVGGVSLPWEEQCLVSDDAGTAAAGGSRGCWAGGEGSARSHVQGAAAGTPAGRKVWANSKPYPLASPRVQLLTGLDEAEGRAGAADQVRPVGSISVPRA